MLDVLVKVYINLHRPTVPKLKTVMPLKINFSNNVQEKRLILYSYPCFGNNETFSLLAFVLLLQNVILVL